MKNTWLFVNIQMLTNPSLDIALNIPNETSITSKTNKIIHNIRSQIFGYFGLLRKKSETIKDLSIKLTCNVFAKKKKKLKFWQLFSMYCWRRLLDKLTRNCLFVAYHYTDVCCTQIKSFQMKQLPIAKNLKITINFFERFCFVTEGSKSEKINLLIFFTINWSFDASFIPAY